MAVMKSLFAEALNYSLHDLHPIGILGGAAKSPQRGDDWTKKRGTVPSKEDMVQTFCKSEDVKRIAILLHSVKVCFALDADGQVACEIFRTRIMPRLTEELQEKINATAHTRSANSGLHWLFEIQHEDFLKDIRQRTYWRSLTNNHHEIKIIGTNQYLIERGEGYESIRGIDRLVTLTKKEVDELLGTLDQFRKHTNAIRKVGSKLVQYYKRGKRQDLALHTAGYLHKCGVSQTLINDLQNHIIELADGDEEDEMRFDAIEKTCNKDPKEVSGLDRLLETVNEDESVIVTIHKEFGKLGYHFNSNHIGNGDARIRANPAASNSSDGDEKKRKIAAILFEVMEQNIEELFEDQFGSTFAAIKIDGHKEVIPITHNGKFKFWAYKIYFQTQNKLLTNTDALTAVCNMLQAKACFGKEVINLDLRISHGLTKDDMRLNYDLANENWEQVEITPEGWSVKKSTEVPTIFRRRANQLPQVYPSRDYPSDVFEQFMKLINATVSDKDGNELIEETRKLRLLLKCYIVTLFIPGIPKAALMLHGDEGGAKSTCQELIKSLIDPCGMLTLTFPQDVKELIQQLSHNYLAYYDNVNHSLPDWVSDLLCRVITGSGFSKRKLYTDDDDVVYNIIRCVGINGINLAATKPDLLDRSIIIRLLRLQKKHRRKLKDDIWPLFERIKPNLLGYIFDILVKVLAVKRNGGIDLDARSRMADWEEYGEIAARCMGYDKMEFIKAYDENKKLKTENVMADSPVAQAIMKLVEDSSFRGTASQLLQKLEPVATQFGTNTLRDKGWPKSASALSRRLNILTTNLRDSNIDVYSVEDTKTGIKTILIHKLQPEPPEPPECPNSRTKEIEYFGIPNSRDQMQPEMQPDRNPETRSRYGDSGGTGGIDGICSTILEKEQWQRHGPYSCPHCSIRFSTSDLYAEHIELNHKVREEPGEGLHG